MKNTIKSLVTELNTVILNRGAMPTDRNTAYAIDYKSSQIQKYLLDLQLEPQNDKGSRNVSDIQLHANWMHSEILLNSSGKILDLGCGPGFYCYYLAAKGNQCTGIDISPLAINHAKSITASKWLTCNFIQDDILTTKFPINNELVIMPYSIFNDFTAEQANTLLTKVVDSLIPGGYFYLEALDYQIPTINYSPNWYASATGSLFCTNPHIGLSEQFWCPETNTISYRIFIIDLSKGSVNQIVNNQKLYSKAEYCELLLANGFTNISFPNHPPGTHKGDDISYISILAQKK